MIPELSSSTDDDGTDLIGPNESISSMKKNQGKIPKKIQKSEREKKKRNHLNDLFSELEYALELARENNCKATILSDTARMLQDLLALVDSLRRENEALTAESLHKSTENNELRDEKSSMEAEIESLQKELGERIQSSSATPLTFEGPIYVMPVDQSHHTTIAYVSRPQARYPNGADSWSTQILCPHEQQQQQQPKERTENSIINFL